MAGLNVAVEPKLVGEVVQRLLEISDVLRGMSESSYGCGLHGTYDGASPESESDRQIRWGIVNNLPLLASAVGTAASDLQGWFDDQCEEVADATP